MGWAPFAMLAGLGAVCHAGMADGRTNAPNRPAWRPFAVRSARCVRRPALRRPASVRGLRAWIHSGRGAHGFRPQVSGWHSVARGFPRTSVGWIPSLPLSPPTRVASFAAARRSSRGTRPAPSVRCALLAGSSSEFVTGRSRCEKRSNGSRKSNAPYSVFVERCCSVIPTPRRATARRAGATSCRSTVSQMISITSLATVPLTDGERNPGSFIMSPSSGRQTSST